MTAPCDHDQLDDLARGALAPAEADALRAHVAACPGCAAELASLRAERALFARRDVTPDTDRLWAAVEARAATPSTPAP